MNQECIDINFMRKASELRYRKTVSSYDNTASVNSAYLPKPYFLLNFSILP